MRYYQIFSALIVCYMLIQNHYVLAAREVIEREIYIRDHKFEPNIIEINSGVKLKLTVHNMDNSVEEFDSIDLKREKIIPGKSKAKIIISPLKPGEYHFMGEFHEDTAQGKVVVKERSDIN